MDWQNMAGQMLTAAKESAGTSWTSIRTIAKHEFEVLAKRFASIAEAVATQQINKGTARLLYRNAKNQIIAVLAMLSTLIASAVTKIVNAAVAVVRSTVNAAVGFSLV